ITAPLNQHHQDMLVAHLLHPNRSKRGNQVVVMIQKHLAVQLPKKQRWNLIQNHQWPKMRHHLPQNLHRRPLLHQKLVQMYLLSQRMKSGLFFLLLLLSLHKIWYLDLSLDYEVQRTRMLLLKF
ncbi:Os10g0188100, partial [Oryza sativa Japonica Group]